MKRTSLNGGDVLARGGKSATFGGFGSGMSQMEWDWTFMKPQQFRKTYGMSKEQYAEARAQAEANLEQK